MGGVLSPSRYPAKLIRENPSSHTHRKRGDPMANHILIDRAFRFPVPIEQPVPRWKYRRDIGAWVSSDEPERLMVSNLSRRADDPRPPVSKKHDIETGEDMKGE